MDEPTCPYGTVLVHNGSYDDGICVSRYSSYGKGTSSTPAAGSSAATPTPAPAATTAGGEGSTGGDTKAPPATTPPTSAVSCGGAAAQSESVRVVDKSDPVPTFGDAPLLLADGAYSLVQATFYRTGQAASPVRALRAALDVKGPTLTLNARDTSVSGLADESLTFLLSSASAMSPMTKTCESVHGSVSAWFFPFAVGAITQPQFQYDGASGFVRVVVSRSDGSTELVFSR